jgi:ADP-heptose:LPS heptosyltransferase
VCADTDTAAVGRLRQHASPGRFFDFTLPLDEYAALVELSEKIISVDTFTVHLACMLKKRAVALYSGTNLAAEWGPFRPAPGSALLQDTRCAYYPCCRMHTCAYGYPSPCMSAIPVEDVIDSLNSSPSGESGEDTPVSRGQTPDHAP